MSFWRITKKQKQEVVNGFRLAGGILLGMGLMGCLIFGTGMAFGAKGLEAPIRSRLEAFAVALVSLTIIVVMVQRWSKYFAGWVGYGVWGDL